MTDSWDARRKAQEEQYFKKQNEEALNRLKGRETSKRPSPITGEPMDQITLMGVVVDRCPTSGGIWLDAGELEQILNGAKQHKETFIESFFSGLFGKQS